MKRIVSQNILNFVLILFLFLSYQIYAEDNFQGFVVCIDPGHQGQANDSQEPIGPGSATTKPCVSSGTSGAVAGPENIVVLDIGLRLHDILIKKGITVVMTHTTPNINMCNSERAAVGNRCKANLSIRLHCDAGSEHGCFTLYPALIENWTDDIYAESFKAAKIVQEAYATYTGIPDQGELPRSDLSGFNWSDVPVILPEMLHMQNSSDDQKISTPEFRQTMAQGLANGILDYLKTLPPPKGKSSSIITK